MLQRDPNIKASLCPICRGTRQQPALVSKKDGVNIKFQLCTHAFHEGK